MHSEVTTFSQELIKYPWIAHLVKENEKREISSQEDLTKPTFWTNIVIQVAISYGKGKTTFTIVHGCVQQSSNFTTTPSKFTVQAFGVIRIRICQWTIIIRVMVHQTNWWIHSEQVWARIHQLCLTHRDPSDAGSLIQIRIPNERIFKQGSICGF